MKIQLILFLSLHLLVCRQIAAAEDGNYLRSLFASFVAISHHDDGEQGAEENGSHLLFSHDTAMGKMRFQDFEEGEEDSGVDVTTDATEYLSVREEQEQDYAVRGHEDGKQRRILKKSNKAPAGGGGGMTAKAPKMRARILKKSNKAPAGGGGGMTAKAPKMRARILKKSNKAPAGGGGGMTAKAPKMRARILKKSNKAPAGGGGGMTAKAPKMRTR